MPPFFFFYFFFCFCPIFFFCCLFFICLFYFCPKRVNIISLFFCWCCCCFCYLLFFVLGVFQPPTPPLVLVFFFVSSFLFLLAITARGQLAHSCGRKLSASTCVRPGSSDCPHQIMARPNLSSLSLPSDSRIDGCSISSDVRGIAVRPRLENISCSGDPLSHPLPANAGTPWRIKLYCSLRMNAVRCGYLRAGPVPAPP